MSASTGPGPPLRYQGRCWVCGADATFVGDERPIREGYNCPHCRASLRYQAQAQLLVQTLQRGGASSVAELSREDHFTSLAIYEPGTLGPFRAHLAKASAYVTSSYWPDVGEGDYRDGQQCENLMHLTYEDESFDLVITSDIFEHVRKPYEGFREIKRVLRDGGLHLFSVPALHPLPAKSTQRVDTACVEDVPILEERYHNGHLVYTDFGSDLLERLDEIGMPTEAVRFDVPAPGLDRAITFLSRRAG